MSQKLTLQPAYGRTYATPVAMLADWNGCKDFRMATTGQYINLDDVAGKVKAVIADPKSSRLILILD